MDLSHRFCFLAFNLIILDDSLEDNFDDSTYDEHDDTGEENVVTEDDDLDNIDEDSGVADNDDLDDISDSDVEEHDDSSEEDLLPKLVLVREHDGRHAVGLVTLAQLSVSRALPLIDHLTLGPGGGKVLGHGPGLDNITQII